jgi:hypothetical protein
VSSQTYPSVGGADDFEVWPFDDEANAVIRQALVVHLEDGVGLAVLRVQLENNILQRKIARMCSENVTRHLGQVCYQANIVFTVAIPAYAYGFVVMADMKEKAIAWL